LRSPLAERPHNLSDAGRDKQKKLARRRSRTDRDRENCFGSLEPCALLRAGSLDAPLPLLRPPLRELDRLLNALIAERRLFKLLL